jgi:N-acetylglucosaminyldiphosphoundecaprenol N-acetyl-beta-D-mannosaminyltransferase
MHNQTIILGVPVDNLTMSETLDQLERFIEIGRATGRSHQIATINADFITNAIADPEVLALLQMADLNIPDGMPIVWGARALGAPIQERVAGVDVVLRLAEQAAQKGYSIYLLGAAEGVAARATEILQQKYPGLKIAGVSSPIIPANLDTDSGIVDEIKAARPDILLVAFGNPKQEKWINVYGCELQVPVMIGVGGTLDLISGQKIRAPHWMQRSGLEWTFRLVQEPKRLWRRYRRNIFIFGPQFARQWWELRNRPISIAPAGELEVLFTNNIAIITLRGGFSIGNLTKLNETVPIVLATTPNILFNCTHLFSMDSTAFGALISLARQARWSGGDLMLAGISGKLAHTLRVLRLDKFFRIFPDLQSGLNAILSYPYKENLQKIDLDSENVFIKS